MNKLDCARVALVLATLISAARGGEPAGALTLVVMDPLAAPLSCPCVEGYAQRDYEKLATFLRDELKRRDAVNACDMLLFSK